jgi:glycosyltransferase involved in cell wall biosynthesis
LNPKNETNPGNYPADLVSVIIPAYNAAPYIKDALDSVFAQTYPHYQVIVVNDGSPDTPALEQVLQPYIHHVTYITQENRGLAGARNTGIRATNGSLVALLDADDIWKPDYLEEPGFYTSTLNMTSSIAMLEFSAIRFTTARSIWMSFHRTAKQLPQQSSPGDAMFLYQSWHERSLFMLSASMSHSAPVKILTAGFDSPRLVIESDIIARFWSFTENTMQACPLVLHGWRNTTFRS